MNALLRAWRSIRTEIDIAFASCPAEWFNVGEAPPAVEMWRRFLAAVKRGRG